MKIAIFISILIAWSFSFSYAQVDLIITDQEISRLDSLMFIGYFDEVSKFFNLKDSLIRQEQYDQSKIKKYNLLKSQYVKPINYFNTFSLQGADAIKKNNNQFKKLSTLFDSVKVGRKASRSYKKFLSLTQIEGKESDALKSYYIAYFFKIKYTQEELKKFRATLVLAENYFLDNKFRKALKTIQTIDLDVHKNNFLFAPVIDSLRSLTLKINFQIASQRRLEHQWQQKGISDYSVAFFIGGNVAYQKEIRNLNLQFFGKDNNKITYVNINKIPSDFVFGYYFMLQFHLKKNIYLGGDLNYTKFSYSSENTPQLVFFNFDLKLYSSHIYAQYLFRKNLGFRPYVSLGLGFIRAKRNRSNATIFFQAEESNGDLIPRFYYISSRTINSPQLLSVFGLEYIGSKNSKFVLRPQIAFYYNFKNHDFIGRFNYSFGMNAGVIF